MNRRSFLVGTVAGPLAAMYSRGQTGVPEGESEIGERPNLVFILVDDMGFSDPGCFGGEIYTPNLDRLAREGIRLTRMHNDAMCVASRSALLSGKWWPRAGMGIGNGPTLAERLKQAGYRTGIVGKWHLNGNPIDRGFDSFLGFLGGFANHFTGHPSYRRNREPFDDFGPDYFSTTAFTDEAIRFIQTSSREKKGQPFFLYLAYQAPHNPLQAPREDIMKYRGRYLAGWQAVREARFRRQKELGVVPADTVLPPYPENLPPWDALPPEQKDLEDLRMSVYAAMVNGIDRGVGRLMKSLEEACCTDNTLVVFCSDNGTDSFHVLDQAMLKRGQLPGDPESNWQPGTGWAYASVTPWRLYKISNHSGGVKTGTIAWWPKGISLPGRVEDCPLHFVDIAPTFLSLAGASMPEGNALAGQSFGSLFGGVSFQRKCPIYSQFADNRALRTENWTLVEVDGAGWELFRSRDITECNDLASEQPQVVRDLEELWLQWWRAESGQSSYTPKSTADSQHYQPQGDRGSGMIYRPTAMPVELKGRYPIPRDRSPG